MDEAVYSVACKLIPPDDESDFSKQEDIASAAVLVLLIQLNGEWNILFTHRTNHVKTHKGEVSFPGGMHEEKDSSLLDTALRETEEEIGIDRENIKIIGRVRSFLTITGFRVFPYVGILEKQSDFSINTSEVERIFAIPIKWLMDRNNFRETDYEIGGKSKQKVIFYNEFESELLWGLTARIAQEVINK